MFLALLHMVHIFRSLLVFLNYIQMKVASTTKINFDYYVAKTGGYRYHKLRKAFSKLYWRHSELNTMLALKVFRNNAFQSQYFYKFKRIFGKPSLQNHFKKIIIKEWDIMGVMRQSACLVIDPTTVYSYGFLFNCTAVGQTTDSMTTLT